MEKQVNFIIEVNGAKGTTFKVRIRQRCPFTGETIKVSKSFKTRKQAEIFKKIPLAQILQGTINQNIRGERSLSDLIDEYIGAGGDNFGRSKIGAYKLIKGSNLAKKRIDSRGWISYITKEAEVGNLDVLRPQDIKQPQIYLSALM